MKNGRFFVVLLALLLLVPTFTQAETTLTLMGLESEGSTRDWSQSLFFSRMAEMTGVSFTFRQYTDKAAYGTALSDAFRTGDLPDVLFKANLTPQQEMDYLASGQLVDLAPLLEEYAPNLNTILNARPDWRAAITQPSGAIASLPVLNGADRQCCIWINKSWLDALSLPMPTTIDEYTEVLRAFRDKDPNGNNKADEIPLSVVGPWESKFLLHAFGLTPNDYNIYVDDAGTVRFSALEPGFRSFVEWLKMALEESLIDPNAFRQMQGSRTTAMSEDDADKTIGGMISIAPYTVVNMAQSPSYQVLLPLAYEGKQVYRQLLSGVGRGAFAITSACADVPAALQWVDTLYTEAGGRLAFAGQVDTDYTIQENGSWKWNSGDAYTELQTIVDNSIIAGDATTPGLEPAAFMRNSEITDDNHVRRQTDTIRSYLVEPFPITWPTDAAREARIAELQAVLGPCVDNAIANFAMGLVELNDTEWAAFEAELRTLGMEEFVSLWQAKYDER